MSDATRVAWLQDIESSLEASSARLSVKCQAAALSEKAQIFLALSRLNERRATVHSTIVDVPMPRPAAAMRESARA